MKSISSIAFALLPLLSPVMGAPASDGGIVARTPGNVGADDYAYLSDSKLTRLLGLSMHRLWLHQHL